MVVFWTIDFHVFHLSASIRRVIEIEMFNVASWPLSLAKMYVLVSQFYVNIDLVCVERVVWVRERSHFVYKIRG